MESANNRDSIKTNAAEDKKRVDELTKSLSLLSNSLQNPPNDVRNLTSKIQELSVVMGLIDSIKTADYLTNVGHSALKSADAFAALIKNSKGITQLGSSITACFGGVPGMLMFTGVEMLKFINYLEETQQKAINLRNTLKPLEHSVLDMSMSSRFEMAETLKGEINKQKAIISSLEDAKNFYIKRQTSAPKMNVDTHGLNYSDQIIKREVQITDAKVGLDILEHNQKMIIDVEYRTNYLNNLEAEKLAQDEAKRLQIAYKEKENYLINQLSLLKDVTELQKLEKELTDGKLASLGETEKQLLINKAIELDSKNKDAEIEAKLNQNAMPDYRESADIKDISSQKEAIEAWHTEQYNLLTQYYQDKYDLKEEWKNREEELDEKHNKRIAQLQQDSLSVYLSSAEQGFGSLADIAKQCAGEQSGVYKAMFAVSKGFAIAQSTLNMYTAISEAIKVGFPQAIPLIAMAMSEGAKIVSSISSISLSGQAHDGIDYIPREGTWLLDKGERVLSPKQNADFTSFLSNGGASDGWKINVINNAGAEVQPEINNDEKIITIAVNRAENRIANSINSHSGPTWQAMTNSTNIKSRL